MEIITTSQAAQQRSLTSVVAMLLEIQDTLDVEIQLCDGCGQERRDNWIHYQAFQALQAAITRVQKAAGLLQLGE